MDKASRVKAFEESLLRTAQPRAEAYYQYEPRTKKYRGIMEYIDENSVVHWVPDRPIISRNLKSIQNQIDALGKERNLSVNHKGISQPWYPESNMPFDRKGNRVG